MAPTDLVPGRDGFNLVADRLGSIPFTVLLVAGSAADEPRVSLLRELLPATLAKVNAHIGRDRIVLAPATLAASAPLKGRAGVITFEPATLRPGVGGHALPDARGSHGGSTKPPTAVPSPSTGACWTPPTGAPFCRTSFSTSYCMFSACFISKAPTRAAGR
ncbi:hypothetical protein [Geothrix sp. 21YS21S-2]|uniref:hypothetical protein n=1 Tax=Geothrix sp. 21YS21S-2 TaxID=3068893 RepID=UPI0027BA4514|nr:hypothetical protein [Geothrix sp. 21YS21S-2]